MQKRSYKLSFYIKYMYIIYILIDNTQLHSVLPQSLTMDAFLIQN